MRELLIATLAKVIVGVAIGSMLLALGLVQLASDALTASAATPGSLPTRIPVGFGLRVYHILDRLAPAPYVEATLADHALASGNLNAAEHYALRLPSTPVRSDLLARVALGRGNQMLAFEYFFAAPDVDALQREVWAIAAHDPRTAYVYESRVKDRLISLRTHPDAVAEAYWTLGRIDTMMAARSNGARRAALIRAGLSEYRAALAGAPLNMTYVLAVANQALLAGDLPDAQSAFQHGLNVAPASADSLAGLGIVALRRGNRDRAIAYAGRAEAINPLSPELLGLERLLR